MIYRRNLLKILESNIFIKQKWLWRYLWKCFKRIKWTVKNRFYDSNCQFIGVNKRCPKTKGYLNYLKFKECEDLKIELKREMDTKRLLFRKLEVF